MTNEEMIKEIAKSEQRINDSMLSIQKLQKFEYFMYGITFYNLVAFYINY